MLSGLNKDITERSLGDRVEKQSQQSRSRSSFMRPFVNALKNFGSEKKAEKENKLVPNCPAFFLLQNLIR